MTSVRPSWPTFDLLLTAVSPVSHGDPAIQDESNRTLFNRQKQLLVGPVAQAVPAQEDVDALCEAHPVPAAIADIFGDLSFGEYVAAALTRVFVELYGRGEGSGIFEGYDRYRRLEERMRLAAVSASGLRTWWDRLTRSLAVEVHGSQYDATLLGLLQQPATIQQQALRALQEHYRSILTIARLWATSVKLQSEEYAEAAGQIALLEESVAPSFDAGSILPGSDKAVVTEVPALSANAIRHQCVRAPSWFHLCERLGIEAGVPGEAAVPPGVEAIFYNGGNIRAGAKQPTNAYAIAQQIRGLYPSLDLLGGVTDSFDLGESRLKVAAWLVCAENAPALVGTAAEKLPAAEVSVYDLMDDTTLTRQGGSKDLGQMIFTFEALAPGSQVLVHMVVDPFTMPATRGALASALLYWLDGEPFVGGMSARGFGRVSAELFPPDGNDVKELAAEYESYLEEHAVALKGGLEDGTLGTGRVVIA